MLNLSDKDLDRLSQEAAQQHEPGDIVGPKFWDKLEARLDRDLGKVNPNPARGIRRLPYYYAPVLLVLLGVTWYLVRLNARSHKGTTSGSPPLTLIKPGSPDPLKPASSSNPVISDKSNSTPVAKSTTVPYPAAGPAPASAPGTAASTPGATASTPGTPGAPTATSTPGSPNSPVPTAASASLPRASTSSPRASAPSHVAHPGRSDNSINPSFTSNNSRTSPVRHRRNAGSNPAAANAIAQTSGLTTTDQTNSAAPNGTPNSAASNGVSATQTTRSPREITWSAVRGPVRLNHRPSIDDSALRAVTQASIRPPITRKYLHINRSLTFGILGGPDFASVSSVAGDRSGSTLGLTVDYQFASHWYLGSGLLLSRKVYGAAPQDYHVPENYYSRNLGMGSHVEYIKGSFSMLEVPLNLRYDFSTTGNTLFFASVGTSSYFFTTEKCGYYYNLYTLGNADKNFTYTNKPDNLFSTFNLSMGFETGISNSLSILVAPYLKMPVRNMGFGQVQLSSFGIDFALRLTPVLSRRRR